MSAQHTPGPWKICAKSDTIIRDQDGKLLAATMPDFPDYSKANARLIAAAPDLAAALAALVTLADDPESCEGSLDADRALDAARAALARAGIEP